MKIIDWLSTVAIVAVVSVGVTIYFSIDAWQKDAVKHGKAEYYLDGNNNKQWRWKP